MIETNYKCSHCGRPISEFSRGANLEIRADIEFQIETDLCNDCIEKMKEILLKDFLHNRWRFIIDD